MLAVDGAREALFKETEMSETADSERQTDDIVTPIPNPSRTLKCGVHSTRTQIVVATHQVDVPDLEADGQDRAVICNIGKGFSSRIFSKVYSARVITVPF